MGYPLSLAHRRFITMEMAIGTVLGSILPATAMYLTMEPFPMPMDGDEGLGVFILKNAFGMGTVMTLIMTLAVRMRVRKGGAPALNWSRPGQPVLRLIPRSILLRAPLFGLCALGGPGLLTLALTTLGGITTIDRLPLSLLMGGSSALIALCLIPFILIGAMSDPASSRPEKGL